MTTLCATTVMAQAPAFPGAEGFGRYTTGGRGGKVVHVTNLNDSGTGSLREAVKGSDKKIVVFDVGGIIALSSDLSIGGNTTIEGQTAPGEGITLRYYTVNYGGDNIIVRFIRFRRGQELDVNDGADATWTRQRRNIILDHCSMSWSIDEVASFYDNRDFTMQWCTIAEALNNAGHGKGAHGYGGIWGGKGASFHHNFLAHLNNRSPRFNGARYGWDGYDQTVYANTVMGERVDFRNCLIYNWGTGGCYGGPGGGFINMVNNYYKAGPGTSHKNRITEMSTASSGNADSKHQELYGLKSRYYINGNYVNGYGADYDWKGVTADDDKTTFTDTNNMYGEGAGTTLSAKLTEPIDAGTVTTHTAQTAYEKVRLYAGASLVRDAQDTRYAEEALNGTATYTGSVTKRAGILDIVADQGDYTLATASRSEALDNDGDGIPNAWEIANGLNPNDASDAITYTIDPMKYYSNIEVYANSLVQDIMLNGNADAESQVEEYYPQYTKTDGTVVEAINLPENNPNTPVENMTVVAKGSITWAFSSGSIEDAAYSADIADYIATSGITLGSNLSTSGTKGVNGLTMTNIASAEKQSASLTNDVAFTITPKDEYYFAPTKISFVLSRNGTNSGVFDLKWQNDGETTTIESNGEINRNKEANGWYTEYSKEISDINPATGDNIMHLYIYNVTAGKSTCIANVVVEGSIYQATTGISDNMADGGRVETIYYNMQGMRTANPTTGTYIKVDKYANGKRTVRKVCTK